MLRWTAVTTWMAVIFGLSSVSDPDIPSGFATPGHAFLYLVLGALLAVALADGLPTSRTAALAVVIASLYGVSDEVHQAFVPGRIPDVFDWTWDTIGAISGAGGLAWLAVLRARRRR